MDFAQPHIHAHALCTPLGQLLTNDPQCVDAWSCQKIRCVELNNSARDTSLQLYPLLSYLFTPRTSKGM